MRQRYKVKRVSSLEGEGRKGRVKGERRGERNERVEQQE